MKEVSYCLIEFDYHTILITWMDKKFLTHRNNNRPAFIHLQSNIFLKNDFKTVLLEYKKHGIYYRTYGPNYVAMDDNNKLKYYWLGKNKKTSNEKVQWIKERNIKLSEENNFEIPDEHKAEFKLRFN